MLDPLLVYDRTRSGTLHGAQRNKYFLIVDLLCHGSDNTSHLKVPHVSSVLPFASSTSAQTYPKRLPKIKK